MSGVTINTSQVNQVAAALTTSAGALGGLAAAALRKTAYDVERTAKALCPVDTGNLRASISTDITGDGRFSTMTAEIGPTADYGAYVEDGTSRHAPQPYLGPAFNQHTPALITAFEALGGGLLT